MTGLTPGFTTRFAPAPTGHLHIGHVVNALWVWGYARAHGGRVLLRIEDHDRGRSRPEFEQSILDDLDWLGLVPDGLSTDDFRRGPCAQRQSDHLDRFADLLASLESRELAYPCDCSRAHIARTSGRVSVRSLSREQDESVELAEGAEIRYPGTCRGAGRDPESNVARRIYMNDPGAVEAEAFDDLRLGPQTQDPAFQCGDLLARDRNGNFTYQFAVVVDDIDQGVDLVIRGEDLLESTGRQIRLAGLLGRQEPPRFLHHPLVRYADGRKLSKSAGDTGIRELREAGLSVEAVLGRAALLGGLATDHTPLSVSELPRLFR